MEELAALIAALFNAFAKRAAGPTAPLGRVLREALAERVAPAAPAGVPAASVPRRMAPAGPAAAVAGPSPAQLIPSFAAAAVTSAGPARRSGASAAATPEAGLVTALFANPQSLVAAFIVAEVLARPVALRDGMTPLGR